eukprot:Pgem_evm1s12676
MSQTPALVQKLLNEIQIGSVIHALGFASKQGYSRAMPVTASKLARDKGHSK